MGIATQIASVTALNLRTIPQRIGNSLVIVIGIAGVVGVLIAVLTVSSGFRQTIANTGRADRGLGIGNQVRLSDGEWTVVGVFSSGGDSHESELIADSGALLSAYRRNSFNSMTTVLASDQAFLAFKDSLMSDPTLIVDVWRENEYFAASSQPMNRILNLVAYGIGLIMAIGAIFGALNTMDFAVRTRRAEIGTLRHGLQRWRNHRFDPSRSTAAGAGRCVARDSDRVHRVRRSDDQHHR